MDELKNECITVSIRIKPAVKPEIGSSLQVISKNPPVLALADRPQAYHFDHIFTDEFNQEQIYDETVRPLVDYVKKGYSSTVFAYGQTGTGKTYTMGTGCQTFIDPSHNGIIPRTLEQIFIQNDNISDSRDISVSFLEIYNEKVFDLLQPNRKSPLPVSGFVVQEMTIKNAKDIETAKEFLELGNKNRHIGETKQNINSSRSHAIFTVYFTSRNGVQEIAGKLNLVDLAGSESVRKTGNKGTTFQEGVNINKGLLSIGQVISALSIKSVYIPYRQSMITSILQGSLNTENYISLIACVSSSSDDVTETLQTLDFSKRAKKICSNPEVNQIITKYKKELTNSNRTPLKRLNATPLKTPARKMALFAMPFINESEQTQTEQSKSHLSASMSSIINHSNISHESFSPVIRKYMTKMEISIMEKLETVIKTTLEKPTKESPLAVQLKENTEHTPCMSWNKIQNEVSKLVRSEIAQLTCKTERATSSPIEFCEAAKIKRILNYETLENVSSPSLNNQETTQDDLKFKIPELPHPKKKTQRKSKLLVFPILDEHSRVTPRRSVRLSMNQHKRDLMLENLNLPFNSNNNSYLCDLEIEKRTDLSQISGMIIGNKMTKFIPSKDIRSGKSIVFNNTQNTSDNFDELQLAPTDFHITQINATNVKRSSARRSLRLASKDIVLQENRLYARKSHILTSEAENLRSNKESKPETIKMPLETSKFKSNNRDSPYTVHTKKVLKVLNEGNVRQLETLHSVGIKTAEQILLFRKLRGKFEEIADLSKVPGWGIKKFERFMVQNMLQK